MKNINVTIEGLQPGLLMHRFPMEPIKAIEKKPPEEQAEISAYRTEDGELYIPGLCLQRTLIGGATFVKGKGRASLQKPVAACVFIEPEYLMLGTKEYKIDSRPVRIKASGGTIVRHRPWLEKWKVDFRLSYDDTLISAEQMRDVVDNAGRLAGLLDFRPANKGPFGRFVVTKWKDDD